MDQLQGLLFDFDGTLVDASQAIVEAFSIALECQRLPLMAEADVRSLIGRPLAEMFRQAAPGEDDQTIERCLRTYREAFRPRAVALSRPLPGVLTALPALAQRYQLAVVTTRLAAGAVLILEGLGLRHHFQAVVGLDQVAKAKPDPEPVLKALQLLEVPPTAAVMVGDTPDDIRAGCAAGTWTVGVTTGAFPASALVAAGATTVLDKLGTLPAVVAQWEEVLPAAAGSSAPTG